jgi:hypothetical protein
MLAMGTKLQHAGLNAEVDVVSTKGLVRSWAVAATVFVLGAVALSWNTSERRAVLAQWGVVAEANFIRWEEGQGQRWGTCRWAVYQYRTQDGATLEARHGCFSNTDAPPSQVTYLPEHPATQLPGAVQRFSRAREAAMAGVVALGGAVLLLLVALLAQKGVSRQRR